jgi:hypothetical protein
LDLDSLNPGDPWMQALENAIEVSDGFLVYVGSSGIQRFVDLEVRTAIVGRATDSSYQVIPILGPGASLEVLAASPP